MRKLKEWIRTVFNYEYSTKDMKIALPKIDNSRVTSREVKNGEDAKTATKIHYVIK